MPASSSSPCGLIFFAVLMVTLFCVDSAMWSNEISDVRYGKLDSDVALTCGASPTGSWVEWRLNGSTLVPEPGRVAPSVDGTLTLFHADHRMEGNYSCYNRDGDLIHSTRLQLGYLPGQLNVSCKMANHNLIQCSWQRLVNTHLPTVYIASYRDSQHKVEACEQDPGRPNECTIWHPTSWHHSHTMNITEVNPLGLQTTLTHLQLHKLLKPDPPEDVTAEPLEGYPSRLKVSWRHPSSWPLSRAYPLLYQLRYRPLESQIWSQVQTLDTTFLIKDALSGHLHLVQVQAKDDIGYGDWSDWSPLRQGIPCKEPLIQDETSPTVNEMLLYNVHTEQSVPESTVVPQEQEDYKSLGVLISLGLLAGVILVMLFILIVLLWVRQKRQDDVTKQELASMMTMKSVRI